MTADPGRLEGDMDKGKIQGIGGTIALAGVASIVLNFINFNLRILMWIDAWGEGVGWAIRVGLVVLGGLVYAAASLVGKDEEHAPATE
jgi:hypothetical protein